MKTCFVNTQSAGALTCNTLMVELSGVLLSEFLLYHSKTSNPPLHLRAVWRRLLSIPKESKDKDLTKKQKTGLGPQSPPPVGGFGGGCVVHAFRVLRDLWRRDRGWLGRILEVMEVG